MKKKIILILAFVVLSVLVSSGMNGVAFARSTTSALPSAAGCHDSAVSFTFPDNSHIQFHCSGTYPILMANVVIVYPQAWSGYFVDNNFHTYYYCDYNPPFHFNPPITVIDVYLSPSTMPGC